MPFDGRRPGMRYTTKVAPVTSASDSQALPSPSTLPRLSQPNRFRNSISDPLLRRALAFLASAYRFYLSITTSMTAYLHAAGLAGPTQVGSKICVLPIGLRDVYLQFVGTIEAISGVAPSSAVIDSRFEFPRLHTDSESQGPDSLDTFHPPKSAFDGAPMHQAQPTLFCRPCTAAITS